MSIKQINSNKNPLIKWVKKLQTKSRFRKEEGLYVVEGYKQFMELESQDIHTIIFSKEEDVASYGLDATCDKVLVEPALFKELSTDPSPQGILAVVKVTGNDLFSDHIESEGLYLALDGIQDPGNLGTMIRVSDAVGATGVLLSKDTVDLYNPKVVKSTMGSMNHIKVYPVDDLVQALGHLKKHGISTFGAYLDDSTYHFDQSYVGGTCFVIGNEGNGISDKVIRACDKRVKIPMPGQSESLNASIAASVLLYEALRQRMNEE